MVKNHTSVKGNIEVDDCYVCGGKFLDNDELVKIREEYASNVERSADVLKYVYSQVGKELAEVDEKYANSKIDRDLAQKLFYKIMKF